MDHLHLQAEQGFWGYFLQPTLSRQLELEGHPGAGLHPKLLLHPLLLHLHLYLGVTGHVKDFQVIVAALGESFDIFCEAAKAGNFQNEKSSHKLNIFDPDPT